jgi:hypothetical protein
LNPGTRGVIPDGTGIVSLVATLRGLKTSTPNFSKRANAALTSGTVKPMWPLTLPLTRERHIQSPNRGFIAVDILKVLVFLSSVNVDQLDEPVLLLHLFKSLLLIPSILRISQIINSNWTGIESENSSHSKNITIKRDSNSWILKPISLPAGDAEYENEYLDSNHKMIQSKSYGLLWLSRLILADEMVSFFVIVFTHGIETFVEWHDAEVGCFI